MGTAATASRDDRDKQLLESELKRLGCDDVWRVEESSDPLDSDGVQIVHKDNDWLTINLDVTHTLANWRKLPDNAGLLKTWEVIVDDDYDAALGKNTGVEWSD